MKKKGFTLVELLVVIAIIAMLLAILMPALNKVRQAAYKVVCATNLNGLGKAMMVYANDYDEDYPVAGDTDTLWDTALGWAWDDKDAVITGDATVSSSLFLLIKYADVGAGSFVCKAGDTKKFDLETSNTAASNYTALASDITECWDFGSEPWDFCSYAYQMPYPVAAGGDSYPLTASSSAGIAVAADRNPWFDSGKDATERSDFFALTDLDNKTELKKGNATAHQGDGQNVLYMDGHTEFEKTPNVGIEEDNIYATWTAADADENWEKQIGLNPSAAGTDLPYANDDSFLASDE